MTVLIDTNFLLAMTFAKDKNYAEAQRARPRLKGKPLISVVVLPELFFMVTTRMDYENAVKLMRLLRTGPFQIEPLLESDLQRMDEIMVQYSDARFDFVDTAIMATAERLNIRQVYTFDRRDFSIFRPKHCEYLDLLP